MTKLTKYYETFQKSQIAINGILNANSGSYYIMFDEFFNELGEDEDEDCIFSNHNLNGIDTINSDAYNNLISELENMGYIVETPYNSSIYITLDGKKCISIRDHDVKNSTNNHWEQIYSVNFLNESFNESDLDFLN